MIKLLAVLFAFTQCSCYVSWYDPYYVSTPAPVYVAPSAYSAYGYTQTRRNYYLRPYTSCADTYLRRIWVPSYNRARCY